MKANKGVIKLSAYRAKFKNKDYIYVGKKITGLRQQFSLANVRHILLENGWSFSCAGSYVAIFPKRSVRPDQKIVFDPLERTLVHFKKLNGYKYSCNKANVMAFYTLVQEVIKGPNVRSKIPKKKSK